MRLKLENKITKYDWNFFLRWINKMNNGSSKINMYEYLRRFKELIHVKIYKLEIVRHAVLLQRTEIRK